MKICIALPVVLRTAVGTVRANAIFLFLMLALLLHAITGGRVGAIDYIPVNRNYKSVNEKYRHVFGKYRPVNEKYRHVFGKYRHVNGKYRHVFGKYRHVNGKYRHVNGKYRHVFGKYRYVIGKYRHVIGKYRHVFGKYRHVNEKYRHVFGKYRPVNEQYKPINVRLRPVSAHYWHLLVSWQSGHFSGLLYFKTTRPLKRASTFFCEPPSHQTKNDGFACTKNRLQQGFKFKFFLMNMANRLRGPPGFC